MPNEILDTIIDSERDTAFHLISSLVEFNIMTLNFTLAPIDKIIFGADEKKGDIWRGAFGEAFRSKACFYRWEQADCFCCDKSSGCFYFAYFEIDKPHPYVISPELDAKRTYSRGEEFSTRVILIGEATGHYEKFIKIIEEAGRIGIGAGRGRFGIKGIEADPPECFKDLFTPLEKATDSQVDGGLRPLSAQTARPVRKLPLLSEEKLYSTESIKLPAFSNGVEGRSSLTGFTENERFDNKEITIKLLTPIKLKDEQRGIYYDRISFETLFKLLIKRIINLNNLYCAGKNFDKNKIEEEKYILLEKSKNIKTESDTEWKDFKRFSSRQNKSMKLGGQRGIIRLSGDLAPFYPYLKLGESIGIGQNTASGFGRYKILM